MARRSGRHGRRKVNVPNVVGTSRTAARASFTTIGLDYSESSTSTSDISLSEITQSQSVVSGQTVLIGSTVTFVYYNYVAPTTTTSAPTTAAPTTAAPTTAAPTTAAPTTAAPTTAAPTTAAPTTAAPTTAAPTTAAPTTAPPAGCTVGQVCGEVYYNPGYGGCSCPEGCYRLQRYNSSCSCVNSGGLIC